MQKINFVLFFNVLIFLFLSTNSIQAQKFINQLNGKRWGITGIYEITSDRQDTLLLVRDCANEYYEFFPSGALVSSYLERDGKWNIVRDSILIFRQYNGKVFKRGTIKFASEDSITIQDKGQNGYFLEVYELCTPDDSTYVDARQVYQEFKTRSLLFGGNYMDIPTAEVGLAITRLNWNRTIYANSLNLELAPQKNIYGLSLNTWFEGKIFSYGLAGTAHSDDGNLLFGMRPMFGLTAQRFFNRNQRSGISCHLMYGYTIFLGNNSNFERQVNRDAVHLRVLIPLQKSDPQVVRKAIFHN